jgi:hypothetical protein
MPGQSCQIKICNIAVGPDVLTQRGIREADFVRPETVSRIVNQGVERIKCIAHRDEKWEFPMRRDSNQTALSYRAGCEPLNVSEPIGCSAMMLVHSPSQCDQDVRIEKERHSVSDSRRFTNSEVITGEPGGASKTKRPSGVLTSVAFGRAFEGNF